MRGYDINQGTELHILGSVVKAGPILTTPQTVFVELSERTIST